MPAKTYTNRKEREERAQKYIEEKGLQRDAFPVSESQEIVTYTNPKILVYFHKKKFLLKDIALIIESCDEELEIVFEIRSEGRVQKQVFEVKQGLNEIFNEIPVPKGALLEVYLDSPDNADFKARNVHFSADLYK